MADNEAGSIALGVVKYGAWIIYAILVFGCIVLGFGFALLLFAADPTAGFSEFISRYAGNFMDPFRGLVEPTKLGNGGRIEWSALFAITTYLILMWLVSLVAYWARRTINRRNREAQEPPAGTGAPPQV